jgi:integrase
VAHIRSVPRKGGGGSFEVRWRAAGRFRQRTVHTREEADELLAELTRQRVGKPAPGPGDGLMRLDEVAEASLRASATRLRARTVEGYQQSYRNHIYPTLGARPITAIAPGEIDDWLTGLASQGLASASVHNHFVALSRVFAYAKRRGLLETNPCEHADLPEPDDHYTATILTPAQIDRLADHLDRTPPYGLIVRLVGYTGLRAGELEGLEVGDIDLGSGVPGSGVLHVRRSISHVHGERLVGPPKSTRSTREVPLRRTLVEQLETVLADHPFRGEPEQPLWPGRTRGSHPHPSYRSPFSYSTFFDNHFKPALADVGLPEVRFHDLRHSAAALWLTAGVSPYKVSRWLGHANIAITDRLYGHLIPDDHARDLALIETYIDHLTASDAT